MGKKKWDIINQEVQVVLTAEPNDIQLPTLDVMGGAWRSPAPPMGGGIAIGRVMVWLTF